MIDSVGNKINVGDILFSSSENAFKCCVSEINEYIAEITFLFNNVKANLNSENMANSFWVLVNNPNTHLLTRYMANQRDVNGYIPIFDRHDGCGSLNGDEIICYCTTTSHAKTVLNALNQLISSDHSQKED